MTNTYHFIYYDNDIEKLLTDKWYQFVYYDSKDPVCEISQYQNTMMEKPGFLILTTTIDNELLCYLTLTGRAVNVEFNKLSTVVQVGLEHDQHISLS